MVAAGSLIDEPQEPTAQGYVFDGWYQDSSYSKIWDFSKDTVGSDMTLYAKWLKTTETGGFRVQEIRDMTYTGNACKPSVTVYDGTTLLKAGKDYTVTYQNNVNVNSTDADDTTFSDQLPYVRIKGKGNYKDSVSINFNIRQAQIAADDNQPADGIKLSVNQQLTVSSKAQAPFKSIKYTKPMKAGKDYTVSVIAPKSYDASGMSIAAGTEYSDGKIPAGCSGVFTLKITGCGNYTGTIMQNIYVTSKSYLMKNVTISLGAKIKSVAYTGSAITLQPAYYDADTKSCRPVRNGKVQQDETVQAADVFTVKYGKTYLIADRDYTISYSQNVQTGKATMTLTGKGLYMGTKSVTFNITGIKLSSSNVTVEQLTDMTYTGAARTQNQVTLTYKRGKAEEKQLTYGTDYTISYTNNVNKGTAAMTFTGRPEAGYTGTIVKKFKILPADITDTDQVTQAAGMQKPKVPMRISRQ